MLVFKIILIACTVIAVVSVVWGSLKTGIVPMPSSRKALQAILASAEVKGEGQIIDLGSGWGTLTTALARKYPGRQVIGYELSFVPWLVSLGLKHVFCLRNLSVYYRDFLDADLSKAALLFCYLSPEGMFLLQKKIEEEQLEDFVIVSNTFAMASYQPERVIRLGDIYRTPVYVYRFFPKYLDSLNSTCRLKKNSRIL
ncbi:MAG: rRNA adenine N-6-methyltransferase family protein [Thermodesulfobacteriota bacterium]